MIIMILNFIQEKRYSCIDYDINKRKMCEVTINNKDFIQLIK